MSHIELGRTQNYNIPIVKIICIIAILTLYIVNFFPIYYSLNQIVVVVVPILVFLCAVILNKKIKFDKWTTEVYVFLVLWLLYSILGLIWVKDVALSITYTKLILGYLLTFIVFTQLLGSNEYLNYAPIMAQMIFYGYCLIYVWEIVTWNHLPSSRLHNVPLPIPTGAFYNENNSAVLMLLLAPFLTIKTILNRSRLGSSIAVMSFIFTVVVTAVQSSRLALILMILIGIYYFFRSSNFIRIISGFIILISIVVFMYNFPKEFKAAKQMLIYQAKSTIMENKSYYMNSSKIRTQLNKESLTLAAETYLAGVGAGNFEVYMSNNRYHRTRGVINAHNWWMEIFANFGLFIFLGILFIYLRWAFRLWKLRQSARSHEFNLYNAYFISLLLFIPLSIIPSSIKYYYSVWIYFAIIHVVCTKRTIKNDIQCPTLCKAIHR